MAAPITNGMVSLQSQPQLNFSCVFRSELLRRVFLLLVFTLTHVFSHEVNDILLCRGCGHEVGHGENILRIPSPLASHQRNDSILGKKQVLIQLFKNPQGSTFEVITLNKEGVNVFDVEEKHPEYSWFPGYAWQITICPKCGAHLGWFFTSTDPDTKKEKSFYGLILDKLLHQGYADSLLVVPKSYQS